MICYDLFFVHIKMSYYQLNKGRLVEKANDRYRNGGGKEKAAEYYPNNREALKESTRNKYSSLPEEEKEAKRLYGRNRFRHITEDEKNGLKECQQNYQVTKKNCVV